MKIALASDHAGFAEKERLKPLLVGLGLEVEDLGTGRRTQLITPTMRARWPNRSRMDASTRACWFVALEPAWRSRQTRFPACALRLPGRKRRHDSRANTTMQTYWRSALVPHLPTKFRKSFVHGSSTDFEGGRHADRVEKIRG